MGDGQLSPFVTRAHPQDYWKEILPGTNGQLDPEGRFILPTSWGKGQGPQMYKGTH
jgi:hypothetical protein